MRTTSSSFSSTHGRDKRRSQAESFINMAKNCSLMSIDGCLKSLHETVDEESLKQRAYTPIIIGKPIVIRYLHFFLKLDSVGDSKQEVMISSFVKTEEEKKAAAESVNFYDPEFRFYDDKAHLSQFSSQVYGHELLYYNKSYLGEPFKLCTKIMELDNSADESEALKQGLCAVGNSPFFVEYLPFIGAASSLCGLAQQIFDYFDTDDAIINGLALNLFYKIPNLPKLQSGRIVCIQGLSQEDALARGLTLSHENKLLDADGLLYELSPYFVLQINSESHPSYESFEHYQNTAEMLALNNRDAGLSDMLSVAASCMQTHADIQALHEMEALSISLDDELDRERFIALFKSVSQDVQYLYKDKFKAYLE